MSLGSQGDIGRLASSTPMPGRHMPSPLTGPVGHIRRSPIIASRRSARLGLLTGSTSLYTWQYTNKIYLTILRDFFIASSVRNPYTLIARAREFLFRHEHLKIPRLVKPPIVKNEFPCLFRDNTMFFNQIIIHAL